MTTLRAEVLEAQKTEAKPILKTQGLTKRFGTLTAVDNFSISISPGEVFGLVGPNGAGKTTVIKMLTTLLSPTAGNAWVAGNDIIHNSANVRRSIGYVPQLLSADGSLTGYENLLIFAKLYHVPRAERDKRIREALRVMDLSQVADKMVHDYSGGMIRKLEIAESMLHRPKVLFLDEPTIGLDPVARNAVWDHVRQLQAKYGTTILLTTHYMEEADSLCDRVAFMHLGKLAAVGSPKELKASVGEGATLDDVFVHYSGYEVDEVGNWREVSRVRRTARRLA
jgi:ABC-2 type transport system ATP-binding protein